jgi:apolipoprotein D and lipocalin family protein
MNRIRNVAAILLALILAGCTGVPEGITPVSGFEPERYLGTWYEIARLDHSFERGLSSVTATYSARDDGGIDVVNRGLDAGSGEWKTAEGRAYFVDGRDRGYLKVSFFGPFYGAYVVFELDADYRHALVAGPSRDYLWLLARTPEPDPAVVERLLARAAEAGFEVDALIRVDHDSARETREGNS